VAAIHYKAVATYTLSFTIGSFGASAVLIYGEVRSPLAQPRNFVGGHVVSALVGNKKVYIKIKKKGSRGVLFFPLTIFGSQPDLRFQRRL
jgi:CBS-domain-containing membrane protein